MLESKIAMFGKDVPICVPTQNPWRGRGR